MVDTRNLTLVYDVRDNSKVSAVKYKTVSGKSMLQQKNIVVQV